jgi:signal transduction histidine kinase
MRPGRRWWPPRLRTLRARVTLVAGLGITAAVVLGVAVLYVLQLHSTRRTINDQLRTYADAIAQSAQHGKWPSPLPASTLDPNAEAQVIAPDGTVLAASRTLTGLPALYRLAPGATRPVRQKAADGVVPNEIQVVAVRTSVDGRSVVIIAGTGTSLVRQLNDEFASRLLLGIPIALVVAAGAVWLIVGRALQPVERIRRAVTAITSADLTRRVPEPDTTDEIGHLAQTMNDMLARLEDSTQRQRRFVADASHELRSPLAGIRTSLEVGLAHPDSAPWPTIANRAVQQSVRMDELLQQLLLLARADDRQLAARQEHVDIGSLITDLAAELPPSEPGVDLHLGSGLSVIGDADQLRRLFTNLVANALRHARSTVTITAETNKGHAVIHVDDDGPGIPAADRERVFDRFVRLDASRERASGTAGLGLAIAREIATAHDGRIAADDRPGGGARLVVTLPLATD